MVSYTRAGFPGLAQAVMARSLHTIGCRILGTADDLDPTPVIGWARKPRPLLACDWPLIARYLLLIGRAQLGLRRQCRPRARGCVESLIPGIAWLFLEG